MLSIKITFFFSLLYCLVCGTTIRKLPSQDGTTEVLQKLSDPTPPGPIQCAPEKSLHSANDIKAMIDYIYNKNHFDKIIKENYQSKAKAIRDKHVQDLNDFTNWFENKPEHLKHILHRLANVRKQLIEPNVKKIADVLIEYPKLEILYNERNDKTNELVNKLNRYEKICQYNCQDTPVKVHNVTKRNVQNKLYCSSIQILHNEITEKLTQLIEKLKNDTNNELSLSDKWYEEKIEELKSNLKDKALKEFGQTMYDILSLQNDYHHFVEDVSSKDLDLAVYSIKSLGLHIDSKLLVLEQTIEKFGQQCNSCGSKSFVRKVRDVKSEGMTATETPNVVNGLIEIKSEEIIAAIYSDWENMFKGLDTLIQRAANEEFSLKNLKPIQEEVKIMSNDEKEVLNSLKNAAPDMSIKRLLELIKKLQNLLKWIEDLLNKLPPYIP